MLRSIGFGEEATAKSIAFEPTSNGLRVLVINHCDETRMHINLTVEDLKLLLKLLQTRIIASELEAIAN